jgi:hypothetical protein
MYPDVRGEQPAAVRRMHFPARPRRRRPQWRIFNSVTSAKTAIFWVAGVSAGIVAGLWMASMTYYCAFCLFAPPRFATWQCCMVGLAVSVTGFGAIIALDREFLPTSFGGIRRVSRFLFEDLCQRQTN